MYVQYETNTMGNITLASIIVGKGMGVKFLDLINFTTRFTYSRQSVLQKQPLEVLLKSSQNSQEKNFFTQQLRKTAAGVSKQTSLWTFFGKLQETL